MNNTQTLQLLSDNPDRRSLIFNLIQKLNCVSLETLSIITGLEKNQVHKVIKSLEGHAQVKRVTARKTNYYGVNL